MIMYKLQFLIMFCHCTVAKSSSAVMHQKIDGM